MSFLNFTKSFGTIKNGKVPVRRPRYTSQRLQAPSSPVLPLRLKPGPALRSPHSPPFPPTLLPLFLSLTCGRAKRARAISCCDIYFCCMPALSPSCPFPSLLPARTALSLSPLSFLSYSPAPSRAGRLLLAIPLFSPLRESIEQIF